ncbi:MAG TPA: fibronectin type III domain-containing protein [Streptosporangiaceae bacterium]|nr:fibronectin type III domain-containing protein [Streptosporangiaceae bacterium]
MAVAAFAGLAASSHGFPVEHVSLNDGSIWVTNNAAGEIARFDDPIGQLDGLPLMHTSPSSSVDVWQDGPDVASYDATGGRMYAVNSYGPAFSDSGQAVLPKSASAQAEPDDIALGGTTLAVLSSGGSLRTAQLSAGGGSLSALAQPLARHLPANSAVAVGSDDTIWIAGGGKLSGYPEGGGTPKVSAIQLSSSDPMQVTTVGNVPVVADPTASPKLLYLPGRGQTVQLPAGDTSTEFELQQPSAASDVVVVATNQALYSVNLRSGALTTLRDSLSGTPSAPVQVAGCVHAAWADGQTGIYVRTCGSPPPAASKQQAFTTGDSAPQLVFRVNNGAVVLNDAANGDVFLIDTTLDDNVVKWSSSPVARQSGPLAQQALNDKTKLIAGDYNQGVRPGTITVVHVLDVAKGPAGETYVVTGVGTPDQSGVSVVVAPDAQTVLATVTTLAAEAHFSYTIEDQHGRTATGQVTLAPRSPGENTPPYLRPNYQQPPLSAASGGTIAIPVIGNWRDRDGDPVYIASGSVTASAGSAAVTSGGALSFTAPQTAANRTVTIRYGVSDGRAAQPTMASLTVSVVGSSSTRFVAPVAEPDAAQAVTGSPVTLQPLANDLPGVDPTNPAAKLALAAPVAAVPGATVSTDLANGTVTFTAQHPGDFYLTYTDAYGAAPTASGSVRVHVLPATGAPKPPVTTPDVAVLHGQQPAVVDVLADDYDPQGWMLGITGAASSDPGIQVSVIDQQWLRISGDDPQPGLTATVDYTVSDGRGSATGTVSVSAVPASSSPDQITTTDAAITVRAGDSAAVDVLAGDASSTGLPLSLAGQPPTANPPVAGLLASVQGNNIRVDAPASVTAEEETTVSYVATDASGATATGSLDVTIEPPPSTTHPDQAPVPQEVDARETAGDVAVISIPVYGVDPDGDSVTVTGVTTAPALGRIVAIGSHSISYQSYPDSAGTDTFTYQVTDPSGLTGTASVRVAVLPAGPPQRPVAVTDVVNAPPGAPLHWDVLGNDYIAPGDTVTVEPLAKSNKTVPPGVRLDGDYVYLRVPSSPSDPPVEFSYGDTDGSTPSLAQVIVYPVTEAKVPPIANDVVAPPPPSGAATVTVNVLKTDDDPVGSPSDLKISWVPAGVSVHGASLTIRLDKQPREVPYQITAPDQLTATAVVYVPGTEASAIRLRPGARITLPRNGSVTVPLGSKIIDTSGRQLKITTTDRLMASPAGSLAVSANEDSAFQLHALGGYTGPGAVTVQVYDGATLQDRNGQTATITIPVQVGPDEPILRCPSAPLRVVEGGAPVSYDIAQLCHVWVDTTATAVPASYGTTWAKALGGVSASVPGGTALQLTAGNGAVPGSMGTLRVTPAGGTVSGTLTVQVIAAPPPTATAVAASADAGHSVTVDLSQYVTSPLAQPDIQVLSVKQPSGATVTSSGSTVTITPAADSTGTISLVATVTDVPGRADRAVPVSISVTVIGRPGVPGTPSVTTSSHTVVVSFSPAVPNGAPVQYYLVYTNGAPHRCAGPPCMVTGLTNGTSYSIYVTAVNSVGPGQDSRPATATPNAVPNQVTGLAVTPGDGTVALTWQPAVDAGTPVTSYQVEISPPPSGGQQITPVGVTTSHTFTGLTNGTQYTFTLQARNALGGSPWSLGVAAIPFGKPQTMAAPTAAGAAVPNPTATRAITVSWTPVNGTAANGRPVTQYTVYEYQAASSGGPFGGTAVSTQVVTGATSDSASFTVNNDSSWYEYAVTATNQAGESAHSSLSSPAIQAAAPPDAPSGVAAKATGQSDTIQFTFTAGAANSKQISDIEYGINGASESGTIAGSFTAGTSYTETLTNATNSAIVNGSAVTVYVAECNDAQLCSSWAGPSGQVVPYQPIADPAVTANANGTTIAYTWSAQSDGLTETLNVCIAGSCTNYTVPATGGYSGSSSATYGYSQTETITAHLTDTAGQSSATKSASAMTASPPPPNQSVSVALGNSVAVSTGTCVGKTCYDFYVTPANFNAGATLTYTCSDSGGAYWTASKSWSGGTVTANNAFYTQCAHALDGETVTISVTDGAHTASGSYKT